MYKGLKVSVVIPCFNEEQGIQHVLERMPDYVDQVIVVDNNSTDDTGRVAEAMGATVIFEDRQGYGRAYRTGLPQATGDIVATVDGDGTYPSDRIAPIIDFMLGQQLDFVSASRFPLINKRAMRLRNVFGNKILTYTTRLLYRCWIADSQSGMWVFRRHCLDKVQLTSNGMAFSEEIKIEAMLHPSIRFGEFHIPYHERIGEVKLFTWRDGFKNLWFLFKRRFLGR